MAEQLANLAKGELEVYSTAEKKIGVWIDGKPLYRKVYEVTTPSTVNTSTIVETIGSEKLAVNIMGVIELTGTANRIPVNLYQDANAHTDCFCASGNLYMNVGASTYTNRPATIIVEYTKTTD